MKSFRRALLIDKVITVILVSFSFGFGICNCPKQHQEQPREPSFNPVMSHLTIRVTTKVAN